MRRPDADLEEKREPRVTSAGAQKGDEVIRAGLTLAAIEKETFAGTPGDAGSRPPQGDDRKQSALRRAGDARPPFSVCT
jgi:hypothetical protein